VTPASRACRRTRAASEAGSWKIAEPSDAVARGADVAIIDRGEAELVDVREVWEWVTSRIPGATLIPMSEIQQRIDEISLTRPVVVYCAVGQRSATVAEALRQLGNQRAYNIAGGIVAWINEQFPVETGPETTVNGE